MKKPNHKGFDWYGLSQRFSIRKYHFGAASVLLGTALVLGAPAVSAEETASTASSAVRSTVTSSETTMSEDTSVDTENAQSTESTPVESTADKTELEKVIKELKTLVEQADSTSDATKAASETLKLAEFVFNDNNANQETVDKQVDFVKKAVETLTTFVSKVQNETVAAETPTSVTTESTTSMSETFTASSSETASATSDTSEASVSTPEATASDVTDPEVTESSETVAETPQTSAGEAASEELPTLDPSVILSQLVAQGQVSEAMAAAVVSGENKPSADEVADAIEKVKGLNNLSAESKADYIAQINAAQTGLEAYWIVQLAQNADFAASGQSEATELTDQEKALTIYKDKETGVLYARMASSKNEVVYYNVNGRWGYSKAVASSDDSGVLKKNNLVFFGDTQSNVQDAQKKYVFLTADDLGDDTNGNKIVRWTFTFNYYGDAWNNGTKESIAIPSNLTVNGIKRYIHEGSGSGAGGQLLASDWQEVDAWNTASGSQALEYYNNRGASRYLYTYNYDSSKTAKENQDANTAFNDELDKTLGIGNTDNPHYQQIVAKRDSGGFQAIITSQENSGSYRYQYVIETTLNAGVTIDDVMFIGGIRTGFNGWPYAVANNGGFDSDLDGTVDTVEMNDVNRDWATDDRTTKMSIVYAENNDSTLKIKPVQESATDTAKPEEIWISKNNASLTKLILDQSTGNYSVDSTRNGLNVSSVSTASDGTITLSLGDSLKNGDVVGVSGDLERHINDSNGSSYTKHYSGPVTYKTINTNTAPRITVPTSVQVVTAGESATISGIYVSDDEQTGLTLSNASFNTTATSTLGLSYDPVTQSLVGTIPTGVGEGIQQIVVGQNGSVTDGSLAAEEQRINVQVQSQATKYGSILDQSDKRVIPSVIIGTPVPIAAATFASGALPQGATAEWVAGSTPTTSSLGNQTGTVLIRFADGSTVTKQGTINVVPRAGGTNTPPEIHVPSAPSSTNAFVVARGISTEITGVYVTDVEDLDIQLKDYNFTFRSELGLSYVQGTSSSPQSGKLVVNVPLSYQLPNDGYDFKNVQVGYQDSSSNSTYVYDSNGETADAKNIPLIILSQSNYDFYRVNESATPKVVKVAKDSVAPNPIETLKNYTLLPGATIEWTTPPITSTSGVQKGVFKITYADGSSVTSTELEALFSGNSFGQIEVVEKPVIQFVSASSHAGTESDPIVLTSMEEATLGTVTVNDREDGNGTIKISDSNVTLTASSEFGISVDTTTGVIKATASNALRTGTDVKHVIKIGSTDQGKQQVKDNDGMAADVKEVYVVIQSQTDKYTPAIPATKVDVVDARNLTTVEQDSVKQAVENANSGNFPTNTRVTVDSSGTATITYPDGTTDVIPGSSLTNDLPDAQVVNESTLVKPAPAVEVYTNESVNPEATIDSSQLPTGTKISGVKWLTAPNTANPTATGTYVGGTIEITYGDGSKDTVTVNNIVVKARPTAPSVNDTIPGSQTGILSTDRKISGTGVVGAIIKVKVDNDKNSASNATQEYTTTVNNDGTWTVDVTTPINQNNSGSPLSNQPLPTTLSTVAVTQTVNGVESDTTTLIVRIGEQALKSSPVSTNSFANDGGTLSAGQKSFYVEIAHDAGEFFIQRWTGSDFSNNSNRIFEYNVERQTSNTGLSSVWKAYSDWNRTITAPLKVENISSDGFVDVLKVTFTEDNDTTHIKEGNTVRYITNLKYNDQSNDALWVARSVVNAAPTIAVKEGVKTTLKRQIRH